MFAIAIAIALVVIAIYSVMVAWYPRYRRAIDTAMIALTITLLIGFYFIPCKFLPEQQCPITAAQHHTTTS